MENQYEILDNDTLERNNEIEIQQIISVNKFIFLSILSFGLYEVWWMYKSWRFFKQKERLDIMPAARAIFSIFFLFSLFEKILDYAKEHDYKGSYSSTTLFFGFFIANLLSQLPDPFGLITFSSIFFIVPAFKALNYAKQNSEELIVIEQKKFNGRQVALIIIGVIVWSLVVIGLAVGVVE